MAVARIRALPPEGRLVVVFGLVSTAAVVVHPSRSDRFITTVMFAYWIGAAAGLVLLTGGPSAGARQWRFGGAALTSAALVVWMLCAHPAASTMRIDGSGPSDLELVSAYAPFVDGRRSIGIAATIGDSRLLDWPLLERCHCRLDIDTFAPTADSRDAVRALSAVWLTNSRADRIVVLDLPQSAVSLPALGWTYDRMAGIVDAAAQSDRFAQVATVPAPAFGGRILILDRR